MLHWHIFTLETLNRENQLNFEPHLCLFIVLIGLFKIPYKVLHKIQTSNLLTQLDYNHNPLTNIRL